MFCGGHREESGRRRETGSGGGYCHSSCAAPASEPAPPPSRLRALAPGRPCCSWGSGDPAPLEGDGGAEGLRCELTLGPTLANFFILNRSLGLPPPAAFSTSCSNRSARIHPSIHEHTHKRTHERERDRDREMMMIEREETKTSLLARFISSRSRLAVVCDACGLLRACCCCCAKGRGV